MSEVMSRAANPRLRYFRPWRQLLVVASAGMSVARAAEPNVEWDGPAECSDVQPVMAVAAELAGHSPLVVPRQWRIRGVVASSGRGWQLQLTLRDGSRERSRVIVAPTCSELTRAAGVALALALDPDEGGASPDAPPAVGSDAVAGVEKPVDAGRAAGRARLDGGTPFDSERMPLDGAERALFDSAERVSALGAERAPPLETERAIPVAADPAPVDIEWRLEADALLDAAALGSAAPGLRVSFGARLESLTGVVYGAWLPARRLDVEGGGRVAFSLGVGGLRGCYELARGLLAADACAGVELGRLAARGEGLENAASFGDWWLAPSLGIALRAGIGGPLYLRAGADAVLPVLREAYRVNDGALVHRAPSVGFRGGVALGVVLGGGG